MVGKLDIGRYDDGSSKFFFPFFGTGVTIVFFQLDGKIPVDREILNSIVRKGRRQPHSFKSLAGRISSLETLLGRERIIFATAVKLTASKLEKLQSSGADEKHGGEALSVDA